MDSRAVENINIEQPEILITPAELKRKIPLTDKARETVTEGRKAIEDILSGKDHRILVVVGALYMILKPLMNMHIDLKHWLINSAIPYLW